MYISKCQNCMCVAFHFLLHIQKLIFRNTLLSVQAHFSHHKISTTNSSRYGRKTMKIVTVFLALFSISGALGAVSKREYCCCCCYYISSVWKVLSNTCIFTRKLPSALFHCNIKLSLLTIGFSACSSSASRKATYYSWASTCKASKGEDEASTQSTRAAGEVGSCCSHDAHGQHHPHIAHVCELKKSACWTCVWTIIQHVAHICELKGI